MSIVSTYERASTRGMEVLKSPDVITTRAASRSAKNADPGAAFSRSLVARISGASVLLGLPFNSASLATADEEGATMQVSVTVVAKGCAVHMHDGASSFASPPSFDVTCASAPHALVEKDPTIHIAKDGRLYVITTVQF